MGGRHLEAVDGWNGVEGEVEAGEAGEGGQPLHAAQLIEAQPQHLQTHRPLQPLHPWAAQAHMGVLWCL